MTRKTRKELAESFKDGAQPNGQDFADLFDSIPVFEEDNINIEIEQDQDGNSIARLEFIGRVIATSFFEGDGSKLKHVTAEQLKDGTVQLIEVSGDDSDGESEKLLRLSVGASDAEAVFLKTTLVDPGNSDDRHARLEVNGVVQATSFVGDGSRLTNVTAKQLKNGTVQVIEVIDDPGAEPQQQLLLNVGTTDSEAVVLKSTLVDPGNSEERQAKLEVNGVVQATSFAGDGSRLTNVTAKQLKNGTVQVIEVIDDPGAEPQQQLLLNVGKTDSETVVLKSTLVDPGNSEERQAKLEVNGVVQATSFVGDGSKLIEVTAEQLKNGTVQVIEVIDDPAAEPQQHLRLSAGKTDAEAIFIKSVPKDLAIPENREAQLKVNGAIRATKLEGEVNASHLKGAIQLIQGRESTAPIIGNTDSENIGNGTNGEANSVSQLRFNAMDTMGNEDPEDKHSVFITSTPLDPETAMADPQNAELQALLKVNGSVQAKNFVGAGSGLSNLKADQITDGLLNEAQIPPLSIKKLFGDLSTLADPDENGELPISGKIPSRLVPPLNQLEGNIKSNQLPPLEELSELISALVSNNLPEIPASLITGSLDIQKLSGDFPDDTTGTISEKLNELKSRSFNFGTLAGPLSIITTPPDSNGEEGNDTVFVDGDLIVNKSLMMEGGSLAFDGRNLALKASDPANLRISAGSISMRGNSFDFNTDRLIVSNKKLVIGNLAVVIESEDPFIFTGGNFDVSGDKNTYFGKSNSFRNLSFAVEGNSTFLDGVTAGCNQMMIDHPLDPLNRVLLHNSVVSPEGLCIYRGKVTIENNGQVEVEMPDYFTILTKAEEATVQLTPIGNSPFITSYEWQTSFSSFIIFGESSREVSFLVQAERIDPAIDSLAKPLEMAKPIVLEEHHNTRIENGTLLHPEGFTNPNAEYFARLEEAGFSTDEITASAQKQIAAPVFVRIVS